MHNHLLAINFLSILPNINNNNNIFAAKLINKNTSSFSMKMVYKITLCLLLLSGIFDIAYAQVPNDLSNVKVEQLSDEQVVAIMKKIQSSGASDSQIEEEASKRGMSKSQVSLLKKRMINLSNKESTGDEHRLDSSADVSAKQGVNEAYVAKEDADDNRLKIYGMSLFSRAVPQFTPNLNMATPISYTIGVGDQIDVLVYGDSEANHSLRVNKEGRIQVPYVGTLAVSGMTIEALKARLTSEFSKVYTGINSGTTKVDINLGEVRSIQVIITGEVQRPGTYSMPSVATTYNALYHAGGPTALGNLREIKVFRNGKLLSELDVYEFMQTGKLSGNITLQDQDVVQVIPYTNRVHISGEVKRELYFDLKEGETFMDLLNYAGGFADKAYKSRLQLVRLTDKERKVMDVLESQYAQFKPENGDRFSVSKIVDRYENRVELFGAVYKPGMYELTPGLSLTMLLQKAEGLKEDAFLKLGYIDRLKPNLEVERLSFNVADVLAGLEEDIILHREDKVYIASLFDLRDAYQVRVLGEVRSPGTYDYAEGMKIDELIFEAGGFTDAASSTRIEVSRRILDADNKESKLTAEIFYVDLNKDLSYVDEVLELQPFDLVIVRSNTGYETQKYVRVEGEVKYPGIYTIQSKDERISDVLERAGGITEYAYAKGASLRRGGGLKSPKSFARESQAEQFKESQEELLEKEQLERVEKMQEDITGEEASLSRAANNYVGIRLEKILKDLDVIDNILIEDGDVLFVPKELQTIKVDGEVLSPITTLYRPNKKFKYYLGNAGGFTEKSLKRRSYVVYANGTTARTKSFLGFKSYPAIEPGAEVYVPQKEERQPLSAQAWVGLGTSMATLAAIIFGILK